ncbi:hypothetical protein [Kineococcus auxinigenes]|uniref:hypothetical protein n=1 Tax=unclassified Kineococcus TaxID=2621656 RepID=UPI003D7E6F3A
MKRTVRRSATAAVALLSAAALWSTGTGSAAAAPVPGLHVERATVETVGPAQSRPWSDDCWRGRSAALCGYGLVTVDLAGFDAYGGIPSCDPADAGWSAECEVPTTSLVETAGTRVDLVVRCRGQLLPRVRSVPVLTERTHLAVSEVFGMTRLDSDTARVGIAFTLPTPSQLGVCPGEAHLLGAVARGVTVGWSGEGAVPAGTARVPGLHRFPLR